MRLWGLFTLILVLVFYGCLGRQVKPTEAPPVFPNRTADEILAIVGSRAHTIQQIKALITIRFEGKQVLIPALSGRSLEAALWVERSGRSARPAGGREQPGQVRLQGFNPVGGVLFDLVSQNGRLKLSAPGRTKEIQTTLEEMLAREEEKSSFSSLLLDALAGGGQPATRPSEFSAIEQTGGEVILYQFALNTDGRAHLARKYWLEANRLLAQQAVYFDPSGRTSLTVLYNDYQPVQFPGGAINAPGGALEVFWPHEISMNLNGRSLVVTTFREVKLNQPFQAGAFSFGMSPP